MNQQGRHLGAGDLKGIIPGTTGGNQTGIQSRIDLRLRPSADGVLFQRVFHQSATAILHNVGIIYRIVKKDRIFLIVDQKSSIFCHQTIKELRISAARQICRIWVIIWVFDGDKLGPLGILIINRGRKTHLIPSLLLRFKLKGNNSISKTVK